MAAITILVVDDDPVVVDVISAHLENEGYSLSTACNGLEAWKMFDDKNYDIVITDLNMPLMTGMELVREIKQKSPRTITIVLTAEGSIGSAVNVMRAGCDDYLLKPILDLTRLSFVIKHSMERRDLLARSLLQGRVSFAKSEYINRMCNELSNPVYCLMAKTEMLMKIMEKTGDREAFFLAEEIQGYAEKLTEITGSIADSCERLNIVEK